MEMLESERADILFEGDMGQLAYDTRRVLVRLLLGPFLDGQRHSKLWPVLVRDEAIVRQRLHELFLDLAIDTVERVAFIRQIDPAGELDVPILLRRLPLTLVDSALMIFLRQSLIQAESHGERAVLSMQDMRDHLANYERHGNVDKSRFGRQVQSAIDKAKDHGLLSLLKGGEDRYEVSPTLKLVFSVESVEALRQAYARMTSAEDLLDPDQTGEAPT